MSKQFELYRLPLTDQDIDMIRWERKINEDWQYYEERERLLMEHPTFFLNQHLVPPTKTDDFPF